MSPGVPFHGILAIRGCRTTATLGQRFGRTVKWRFGLARSGAVMDSLPSSGAVAPTDDDRKGDIMDLDALKEAVICGRCEGVYIS